MLSGVAIQGGRQRAGQRPDGPGLPLSIMLCDHGASQMEASVSAPQREVQAPVTTAGRERMHTELTLSLSTWARSFSRSLNVPCVKWA